MKTAEINQTVLRRHVHRLPAAILAIGLAIQIAIWDAPPEIRWDGSIQRWPIAWMICSGSISGFAAVLSLYLLAWVIAIVIALRFEAGPQLFSFVFLAVLPLLGYGITSWHYFA